MNAASKIYSPFVVILSVYASKHKHSPYRENVDSKHVPVSPLSLPVFVLQNSQTRFGSEIERMSPLSIAPDEASVTPIKSTRNSSES